MVQMPIQHHFIIPTNSTSNPRREVTVIKYCEPTKSELHAKKSITSYFKISIEHKSRHQIRVGRTRTALEYGFTRPSRGHRVCARLLKTDFWETTIRIWIKFDQIEKQEVNLVCSTVIRV